MNMSMMSKKKWAAAFSGLLVAGAIGGTAAFASQSGSMIGLDKASEVALKHATGQVEGIELEREVGKVYYEVDVKDYLGRVFEIHVDAYSGDFLGKYVNVNDDAAAATSAPSSSPSPSASPTTSPTPTPTPSPKPGGIITAKDHDTKKTDVKPKPTVKPSPSPAKQTGVKAVTKEQAVQIAQKAVSGKLIKVKKDREDGRFVYEVKLSTDKGMVEVDVDAATGKITEVDRDDWKDGRDDRDDRSWNGRGDDNRHDHDHDDKDDDNDDDDDDRDDRGDD